MKDGSSLVIDGTTYSMEQTVTGRPTSTYDNVLTIGDSGSRFGTYSCEVSNEIGSSGQTAVNVLGELIQPISAHLEYTGKLQTADTHFRYLGQLINVHVGG